MKVLKTSKNPAIEKVLFEFTNGIDVDRYLAIQEVKVQKAWANGLQKLEILKKAECEVLFQSLDDALEEIQSEKFNWRAEDEDIHMNLERYLTEKVGDLGKKIHWGRSRNDLIATTLKLFVTDAVTEVKQEVAELAKILSVKAEENANLIVAGMTHLQNGQPIRLGHILASYGWALMRDLETLDFIGKQTMSVMPLGSGALAGTTLEINLLDVAKELGFKSPPKNSYDSVGDRDFMIASLGAFSSVAIHLSRMSEDFIIWASAPFSFLKLPVAWSTGSSIMPNKRNPDVPELVRAKASHVISASTNAQMLVKALPSSYASDLHEMKSIFLRSLFELKKCLGIMKNFVAEIEFDKNEAQVGLKKGHLLATEIANELTSNGMSFRDAYSQVASLVEEAQAKGVSVEDIAKVRLPQMATMTFEVAVENRSNFGGTSLMRTLEGINELKAQIKNYF